MIVYIIPIAVLYLCSFVKGERLRKNVFLIMCLYLTLISGIRYMVGTDYDIQIKYYEWTVKGLTKDYLEFGFRIYILLIERIFHSVNAYFFISSVFVMGTFAFGIVKFLEKEYRILALALYVTSTIFFGTMNIERQYIAIGFLIISLYFLLQKKYIQMLLMFVFAVSFHNSAIVFLLYYALCFLYKFWNEKIIRKIYNIIVSISVMIVFIDIRPVILKISSVLPFGRYEGYLTSTFFENREKDSFFKCIFPMLLWILIMSRYQLIKNKNSIIDYLIHGLFLYIVINNMFYGINVFLRINMYFEWFIIFVFPLVVCIGKNAKDRFYIKVGLLGYYLALTVYAIFINNGHTVLPYQTIYNIGG